MSDPLTFTGYANLTLDDLARAYKKAKVDCFVDGTYPTAIKFSEYEEDLITNLQSLLSTLKNDQNFASNDKFVGEYRVIPKKLTMPNSDSDDNMQDDTNRAHIYFPKPSQEFDNLPDDSGLKLEFRIVGDFPIDTYVLSALWTNLVGHKFDACLDASCYGMRLKRMGSRKLLNEQTHKIYDISALGSFPHYHFSYHEWRDKAFNAIRKELEDGKAVMAASLDLKSYYHGLEPTDITLDRFQKELGLQGEKELSEPEKLFNKEFTDFLHFWSDGAKRFAQKFGLSSTRACGGLAIGLNASRIIANIMLHGWDKLIKQEICPIYYGRYVDDMLLVMRDPGSINSGDAFMEFIQKRLGKNLEYNQKDAVWEIRNIGCSGRTKIRLQPRKQKLFVLSGRTGLDLLSSIEREIQELSSEHRLLPSPDQFDQSAAAKILYAHREVGEKADALKRIGRMSVQRWSWSLQLRHVETLANDLPLREWKTSRNQFYQLAHDYILQPKNLFTFFKYLPRLLGFAVTNREWHEALRIVTEIFDAIDKIVERTNRNTLVSVNGAEIKARRINSLIWGNLKETMATICIEATVKCYPTSILFKPYSSPKFTRLIEQLVSYALGSENSKHAAESIRRKALSLAKSDLAKVPYRIILREHPKIGFSDSEELPRRRSPNENEMDIATMAEAIKQRIIEALYASLGSNEILSFLEQRNSRIKCLEKRQHYDEGLLPYLFPTRPYTQEEITELVPACVGPDAGLDDLPSKKLREYVCALRGSHVQPIAPQEKQKDDSEFPQHSSDSAKKDSLTTVRIGTSTKNIKNVIIALTSLETGDDDWAATACNKPNLTHQRYERISRLVNQTLRLRPKPDYVVFPELSIPLKWIDSVAGRLKNANINLIAGTEYLHENGNKVVSKTCLVLSDDRLGYPSTARIWQPKSLPAAQEEHDLIAKFGKRWHRPDDKTQMVYNHNGFHFGILACSELRNIQLRANFQGEVDAIVVLSWNKDLDTFSLLIEATALDVHAYTILVNNRKYGDSRVRSPAKKDYRRDLARIRGGNNDFVVAVSLDIDSLRAFQSRAKRWPNEQDPYKPVPEGFRLSTSRKRMPPK